MIKPQKCNQSHATTSVIIVQKYLQLEINSGTKVNLIYLDKGQKGKYTRSHNSVQNKGITCN